MTLNTFSSFSDLLDYTALGAKQIVDRLRSVLLAVLLDLQISQSAPSTQTLVMQDNERKVHQRLKEKQTVCDSSMSAIIVRTMSQLRTQSMGYWVRLGWFGSQDQGLRIQASGLGSRGQGFRVRLLWFGLQGQGFRVRVQVSVSFRVRARARQGIVVQKMACNTADERAKRVLAAMLHQPARNNCIMSADVIFKSTESSR